MLTVTAPGVDHHLQYDPGWARGTLVDCPCAESAPDGLGYWNAGASGCWNRLRTALRRLDPQLEFFRAAEIQKRGAIHLHVLVRSTHALDVLHVQALALAAGFGCVVDLAFIVPGSRKQAYYVSKYVTKAADSRDEVPWTVTELDPETGELRSLHTVASYRTWSASRRWGLTMRQIRDATRTAARAHAAHTAIVQVGDVETLATDGSSDSPGPSPPL